MGELPWEPPDDPTGTRGGGRSVGLGGEEGRGEREREVMVSKILHSLGSGTLSLIINFSQHSIPYKVLGMVWVHHDTIQCHVTSYSVM